MLDDGVDEHPDVVRVEITSADEPSSAVELGQQQGPELGHSERVHRLGSTSQLTVVGREVLRDHARTASERQSASTCSMVRSMLPDVSMITSAMARRSSSET